MTAATQEDRAALSLRHQTLGALEAIVYEIAEFARRVELTGLQFDGLDVNDDGEGTIELHDRLWPDDEGLTNGEFYEDASQHQRLAAAIFAALAGPFGQEFLVSRAMQFARLEAINETTARRMRADLASKEGEGGDPA